MLLHREQMYSYLPAGLRILGLTVLLSFGHDEHVRLNGWNGE